jgi:hypothetical protein
MKTVILMALVAAFALVAFALTKPDATKAFLYACGEKVNDAIFGHMARSGMVLGMAELATVTKTSVAIAAGRKVDPTAQNRSRFAVITTAPAWTAANGDTAGTGITLLKGSRLICDVVASFAAGAASSTLSVGLRDAVTKVAVDATAIVNALAITAAATSQVNTGTKMVNGQDYVLPQDCEIYLTFGGAAPTANQAIRLEIPYIAP